MVLFLMALMLAPPAGTIGENRLILRDPQQGPMPVTDKYIVYRGTPECTTPHQKQAAAVARIKGLTPDCTMPSNEERADQPRQ
jgi:hypothetical protein